MDEQKPVASVIDMTTFKITKKLKAKVDELKRLAELYATCIERGAELDEETTTTAEKKTKITLPKAEQRLEALKSYMRINRDPYKLGGDGSS